jgi:dTDP-4-dehydrorhamnose reductase
MNKAVVLVTGKDGQLGNELQQQASSFPSFDFIFNDKTDLDITNASQVDDFFASNHIDFCINAAAYTAVDKAEVEKDFALSVNEHAVANLAAACTRHGARFIHVSTDYVFDGNASTPYEEDHEVSPVNFYGETKLRGEKAAQENNPSCIIVRTSWVYSTFGNNFVKTMLRLMADRDSLNVVSDQVGSPTYAADLAKALLQIVQALQNNSALSGIYHYSNEGVISWYDFAVAIKEHAGLACTVNPIPTSAYPTPTKRPAYSVLNKDKIKRVFGLNIPQWEDSLKEFFTRYRN